MLHNTRLIQKGRVDYFHSVQQADTGIKVFVGFFICLFTRFTSQLFLSKHAVPLHFFLYIKCVYNGLFYGCLFLKSNAVLMTTVKLVTGKKRKRKQKTK